MRRSATNFGHGRVYIRPDGFVADCSDGRKVCQECMFDYRLAMAQDFIDSKHEPPRDPAGINGADVAFARQAAADALRSEPSIRQTERVISAVQGAILSGMKRALESKR